ncbi:MAG: sulfate ABC transporter permease subunit CysT [Kiritimatiellia bacterium]
MKLFSANRSVLPGFGLNLGFTLLYLSLIVLIPLSGLIFKTATMPLSSFIHTVCDPRVLASFRLTLQTSLCAASINAVFGFLIAWVLVRYSFFGKGFLDSFVDLPFALPTAVAGITLAGLFAANGWVGRFLEPMGLKIAYTPLGIVVALTFVGIPFVIRTVQPVLEDFEREQEEAAVCLGATRLQVFTKVIFPSVLPALLTGFSLAFARGLGEYGSVIFIAGNMPMVSEITPLLIVTKLEQYDYKGATAIASVMLMISFLILLSINLIQRWSRRFTTAP